MFWPFRLLIAALVSLVILTMILNTIGFFDQYKAEVSWQRFIEAFDSAYNARTTPDKAEKGLIKTESLFFLKTTLSASFFANRSNLPDKCVNFQAPESSPVKILNGGQAAEITQNNIPVAYFQCFDDQSRQECNRRCYISFSLPPKIE
jgi:hypothetical protein